MRVDLDIVPKQSTSLKTTTHGILYNPALQKKHRGYPQDWGLSYVDRKTARGDNLDLEEKEQTLLEYLRDGSEL